jgi:hypothetical protein
MGPRAGLDVWSRKYLFPENGQLHIFPFTLRLVNVYEINFVVLAGEVIILRTW